MFQYLFSLSILNILDYDTNLHIEVIYNKDAFNVLNGNRDSLKFKSSLCEGCCCHWLAAWNGGFLLYVIDKMSLHMYWPPLPLLPPILYGYEQKYGNISSDALQFTSLKPVISCLLRRLRRQENQVELREEDYMLPNMENMFFLSMLFLFSIWCL